ncbi:MAG: phosphomannomutase/phosphoglucomutase [Pseudomonadota bacterium]
MELTCFKAYDIRGVLGETLDAAIAERIGRAFADTAGPGPVVVGYDARPTSPALAAALAQGLIWRGRDVIDIGLCGTEEVYFATAFLEAGGGIMVTASHNPIEYNGMKIVGPGSRPLDPATELAALKARAEADQYDPAPSAGQVRAKSLRAAFADHVAGFADASAIGPMRILVNAGNGTAGAAFDTVAERLIARGAELDIIRMDHAPDPSFPNGIPNPMLSENRVRTAERVRGEGADLAIAWDGDFDRCFFYDETGELIPGELVVALLADATLRREAGAAIVYDPRVTGAVEATIAAGGGRPTRSRVGHAFVKGAMRGAEAAYGGEMSAHHYYRDFFYCGSGMIPWVQMLGILTRRGGRVSELVADLRQQFPSSGEINFTVRETKATMERVVAALEAEGPEVDRLDGVSLDFGTWRMNIRPSNTEPLLRLNLETKGDAALLDSKMTEIRALIETHA